jgi:hypothetical protein
VDKRVDERIRCKERRSRLNAGEARDGSIGRSNLWGETKEKELYNSSGGRGIKERWAGVHLWEIGSRKSPMGHRTWM